MRNPLKPILMSVAACVLWGSSSVAQTTEQPNVVLMMVDNLGWGELGVYGGGELRSLSLSLSHSFADRTSVFV